MGVKLTVIGCVRGLRSRVILNRHYTKPWEVLEIYSLGYLKGVGDKYSFFIIWWEVSFSRVFYAQFFAPSLK